MTFPAVKDASLRKDYPTHGESDRFRAFVTGEVKSSGPSSAIARTGLMR